MKLRSTPVNSLAYEDDFPFIVVGGGQGRVSIAPHPGKDQPLQVEEDSLQVPHEGMNPYSGDGVDYSRFLHGMSCPPGVSRRITRIHKVAISPDGSRCLVGGDGKGATFIEFWAFDRFKQVSRSNTAMDVDESTTSWQEVEHPTGSASSQVDEARHFREDDGPGIEFLPVPSGAETLQTLGINVVNVPAGLYNF